MARAPSRIGPFQGAMLKTTPAAWRIVSESVPGLSVGRVSPWIWVARPAASRNRAAEPKTLKRAHSSEEPTSAAMTSQNSGSFCSRISAALSRMARRVEGPVADHEAKARAADSAAAIASFTDAAAPVVTTSWLTG